MTDSPRYAVFAMIGSLVLLSSLRATASPTDARDTSPTRARARDGFGIDFTGGTNVLTPYGGVRLGRRFSRANYFELYLDYSYGAAISAFPFHTVGLGTRAYLVSGERFELFHQSLFAVGISSGGTAQVPNRTLGEQLLGAFMTQGLGVNVWMWRGLHAAFAVSTGYPVWLRPELSLGYRF